MSTVRSSLIALSVVISTIHCGDPNGPQDALRMTVVSAGRDSSGVVHVDLEFANTGSATLFLSRCGATPSAWLQIRSASGWDRFGGGVCLTNLDMSPFPIGPGASVRSAVAVGPGPVGNYRAGIEVSDVAGRAGHVIYSAAVSVQ